MLKKKLLTDRSGQLHEDLENELAKTLQEEIDAAIMRDLLVELGWNEVVLDWVMTHEVSAEVDLWIMKNTKGKHWTRGLVWLFEKELDAMWFKMRWLG